jgi:Ca2+:H+ antiporter
MDLNFHPFQLGVLAISIFVVSSILNNGQSTWVEGVMLLVAYVVIALVYFFESPGTSTYGAAPVMPVRKVPPAGKAPLGKMKVKVPLHAPNQTHV